VPVERQSTWEEGRVEHQEAKWLGANGPRPGQALGQPSRYARLGRQQLIDPGAPAIMHAYDLDRSPVQMAAEALPAAVVMLHDLIEQPGTPASPLPVSTVQERLAEAGYCGLSEQRAAIGQAINDCLCTALGKEGRPTHLEPNPWKE
jgi:hypothetical protein